MLDALEKTLENRQYLVGDWMTLADILLAIYITRGLEWVLGEEWRDKHPAVTRHVVMVMEWAPVRTVVPEFIMAKEEQPNIDPKECV